MIDPLKAVDLIERANDAQRACTCGRPTTTIWRDGAVWLVCSSLTEHPTGRVGRLLAAISAATHTQRRIVDVPAASRRHAAAGC